MSLSRLAKNAVKSIFELPSDKTEMTAQEFREMIKQKSKPVNNKKPITREPIGKIKDYEYAIGIDGSFRKDGLAVSIYHIATRETETATFESLRHFQKWFDGVGGYKNNLPESAIVFYEDTGKQEIVIDALFNKFCVQAKMQNNKFTRDKYAISVGKNIAATNQVRDLFIERYKRSRVHGVTPLKKGRKLTAREMKVMYQVNLRQDVSQDELDATAVAIVGYAMYKDGAFLKQCP